ncbi:hypothetical protein GNZ24_31655 [Burkholderia thailandensis]|uniref:hypothetical protein n=1 Tax=Burkholderia thailandensis TaxID=57975 RepID=UPI0012E865FA|nr:hypothetical protein [Burkholderia thailandensis]MUV29167.1 hypothetical protein [Burkholderia thailandensis]MUV31474.1 hypothetical protein [Burkholderia thailandensis]
MNQQSDSKETAGEANPYDVLCDVGHALRAIESESAANEFLAQSPFADRTEGVTYMVAALIAAHTATNDGSGEVERKRLAELFAIHPRIAHEIAAWLVILSIVPPEVRDEA